MKIPWNDDRCIFCVQKNLLSIEHLIPRSIGGKLTSQFLCKSCNDRCGHTFESNVKSDLSIRLAAAHLIHEIPILFDFIENGQEYITNVGPERRAGWLKDGSIRGIEGKLSDGSTIHLEENTPNALRTILNRSGECIETIETVIRKFEESAYDTTIELAPGLRIRKWKDQISTPNLAGEPANPLIFLKIAYEFAALLAGSAILEENQNLQSIRHALLNADEQFAKKSVERLFAQEYGSFHGICYHGNDPEAVFQIRLFGKLAYRVRLPGISIDVKPITYTHYLVSGEEIGRILD